MRNLKRLFVLLLAALPMMAGADSTATIIYGPVVGTPTLGETMLVALALLLPVVAFRSMRNMKGGRTLASWIVAGGLLGLSAIGGYQLLPSAQAIIGNVLNLSNPAGGTGVIDVNISNPVTVTNTSGGSQRIQSVNFQFFVSAQALTGNGYCAANTLLANGASCTLAVVGTQQPQ